MVLLDLVSELYSLSPISNSYKVRGGHDGDNSIIETHDSKYFLKQYKDFTESRVVAVHKAYEFFVNAGVPAVTPLKNNKKNDYFPHKDNFYALFPFIEANELKVEELNALNITSMGKFLGKMHRVVGNKLPSFSAVLKDRDFGVDGFNKRVKILLDHLNELEDVNELQKMNIRTVSSKHKYINGHKDEILELKQPSDVILLHRDFHERNIFFDSKGEVFKIFDFDKALGDSRYVEISRTLLYVCSAGKFEKRNFNMIKLFLQAYVKEMSLDKDKLRDALKFYVYDNMFSLWVPEQYYLKGDKRAEHFMEWQHDNQAYMELNLEEFINRVSSYIV